MRPPYFEEEGTAEEDERETSFPFLWSAMVEDGFVVDGGKAEEERIRALYAEVCAALDRQKARVTPEAVFEAVEEVNGGLPLSPERHAQAICAAEWYAGPALTGRSSRRGRRPARRDRLLALFRGEAVEEAPQDPAIHAIFPFLEEVEYGLCLAVPPATVSEVYGAVAGLYRTFGVCPDFPTLVERLRQDPDVLRAGYAPVWYVWRTVTDLHHVIRDRMQKVLDAAER
jgi:hypothetical protein